AGAAIAVTLAGGLAIPALHTGLGGLFPRYDGPNPVAVALGPGGLFALVLSTALAVLATVTVSAELRALIGALLRHAAPLSLFLPLFFGAAAAAAAIPMVLAGKSLKTRDITVG
ncbi:MAG: hypothetical protein WCC53_07000, partial [Thermoanaerobaculia bacterium]